MVDQWSDFFVAAGGAAAFYAFATITLVALLALSGGAVRALDGDPRNYSAVLATGVLLLLGIALSNSWQLVLSHEADESGHDVDR